MSTPSAPDVDQPDGGAHTGDDDPGRTPHPEEPAEGRQDVGDEAGS